MAGGERSRWLPARAAMAGREGRSRMWRSSSMASGVLGAHSLHAALRPARWAVGKRDGLRMGAEETDS